MGNIGGPELLVVLIVALLVLGPTRLPQAARQMGKAMSEFRRVTGGLQAEVRDAMSTLENEVNSTLKPEVSPPKLPPAPQQQAQPMATPPPVAEEPAALPESSSPPENA